MYYQFVIYNGYLAGMVNSFYFEVVGVGFYILLSIIILTFYLLISKTKLMNLKNCLIGKNIEFS